jgi:UDPglucose 6-dehydrogenase
MDAARQIYAHMQDKLVLMPQRDATVPGADALVICTEWKQFRIVDFEWLKGQLRSPVVIDGRNLYEPEDLRRHGLLYYAIGRGDSADLFTGRVAEPKRRAS